MPRPAVSEAVSSWRQLLAGAEGFQESLPALEAVRDQLATALARLQAAQARQQSLKLEARQATQELRAAMHQGQELAERFRSGARLLYGRDAAKLKELGIKVRRRLRARASPGCKVKGCPLEPTATAK